MRRSWISWFGPDPAPDFRPIPSSAGSNMTTFLGDPCFGLRAQSLDPPRRSHEGPLKSWPSARTQSFNRRGPGVGQACPILGRGSGRVRPISAAFARGWINLGSTSAELGTTWAKLGANSADVAHISSGLYQIWTDFDRTWLTSTKFVEWARRSPRGRHSPGARRSPWDHRGRRSRRRP